MVIATEHIGVANRSDPRRVCLLEAKTASGMVLCSRASTVCTQSEDF